MLLRIILLLSVSLLYSINPPKDMDFPIGFWDEMRLQDIGNEYGDTGWRNKMAAHDGMRDAQLTFNIPVLLGKYSDATTYFTASDFQNMLFDNNSTGSMKEYYTEISHGNFTVDGAAGGWYQSSYTMSDANSNTKLYVSEIAQLADPDFDYSQFDNDGPDNIPNSGDDDGYVDGIAVVYSGCGAEWGPGNNNLWPHMSSLGSTYQYITGDVSANGGYVIVNSYFVAPELSGGGDCNTTTIRPVGVYAHEFGHVLGLPDLYDRDASNGDSEGIGNWCLMAGGSWNGTGGDTPAHLSAWCKQEMGWLEPTVLTGDQDGVNIPQAETNAFALKIWEDDYQWSRYFLVENRQQTGFDAELPGNGLMIYHVDENRRWGINRWSSGSVNDNHTHKFVDVEEADGDADMDNGVNRGDGGDPFPGSTSNTSFSSTTNPNSNRYDGSTTTVSVTNISSSSSSMTVDITLESREGIAIAYDSAGISGWGYGYGSASPSWGGVLFQYSSSATTPGYLTEVDIGFRNADNSYTLYVYDALGPDGTNFSPGNLLLETTGTFTTSGWASVAVDSILIQPGQEFFIASMLNEAYAVSFDNVSPYSGRSYFSGNGTSYSDMSGTSSAPRNINIRAKISNSTATTENLTYVPDDNFEQALIDLGYDDVIDDYVATDSISGVTSLTISNYQNEESFISDLTGIQDFTALTYLHCSYNSLTALDLSSNTALTELRCFSNELTALDVSANTALVELHCGKNELTSLDVSNNTALTSLGAQRNSFTSLDVSNNTALEYLDCHTNAINSLNVSNNTALTTLYCHSNQLTALNMRNGVTDQLTTFDATNNALVCIEVNAGDVDYATTNWTYANGNIDDGVTFSEICTPLISVSPSELYEQLIEGTSSTQTLTISNDGESDLEWEIASDLIDLTGTWNLNYDWSCNGSPGSTTVTFSSDGTFETGEGGYGTWSNDDGSVSLVAGSCEAADFSFNASFMFSSGPTYFMDTDGNSASGIIDAGSIGSYDGDHTMNRSRGDLVANTENSQSSSSGFESDKHVIPDYDSIEDMPWVTLYNNGRDQEWLSTDISTGTIPPGSFQDVVVSFDATSIGFGDYAADLSINSNDPDEPNVNVPVSLEVIPAPPVIAAIEDTSMDEDSELSLQLSAESEQGYDIYFEAESDTSSVYVYVEGDMLHINLETDWNGSSEITVLAYSEFSYESNDTARFTLTVNPVDDLPFVDGHILPRYYPEDFGVDTIAYLPDVFVDIDGELTFSYSFTDSSVLAADVSSDHLVLSSIADAHGETELLVTATNPTRASVTDTVQLSVWPVNDAPVVSIPDTSMNEDSEFFYDLSDYITDVDSEDLLVSLNHVSEPMSEHVIFQMMGPDTLRMFSRNNWFGTGNVRIRVNDGQIATNDPFTLTVNPVNDAPVFGDLSALVGVGIEFQVPIHVYDVDMDTLVVSFNDSWDYPDWLSLAADPYRLEGTAPNPGQSHFPLDLSDGDTSVTDTFTLSAAFFHPRITSITDVPDDQGGRVYISFLKSFFDHPDESNQMYTVFRHDMVDNTPDWVVVGSGAAIGDGSYTYEVSTLVDSTSEGDGMTEFKVVASMDEGHFHSLPASGYSVDNIAPGVPQGLMAVIVDDGIQLTWEMGADEDFQYYILEKSSDEAFTEPQVFETIDIAYLDLDYVLNESNYYHLAAVDHAGNMSDYSDVVDIAVLAIDLDLIPEVFALHQNYPNPFNPTTQIKYDLPEDAMVSITIYDLMGRRVKSLVNTTQSAGYRFIQWNATNNLGEPVSAGMYIYMIQAGEFRKTKKMVLLK